MRILDRIAAWFGYVPRDVLLSQNYLCVHTTDEPCTVTTVKERPAIIVSADFKRGIPWS